MGRKPWIYEYAHFVLFLFSQVPQPPSAVHRHGA